MKVFLLAKPFPNTHRCLGPVTTGERMTERIGSEINDIDGDDAEEEMIEALLKLEVQNLLLKKRIRRLHATHLCLNLYSPEFRQM